MTSATERSIAQTIAHEIGAREGQIATAMRLLDEGASVPFIARYRKEMTSGLTDEQLRTLERRLAYLRGLEARRETILRAIDEQGRLTPQLRSAIAGAQNQTDLEDLYAPYRQKRRTKAMIAREAGLEPLAQRLLATPALSPDDEAGAFIDPDKGIAHVQDALDGARSILIEQMCERPALLRRVRERLWSEGVIRSTVVPGKEGSGEKYADYFGRAEPLRTMASHRVLALLRAHNEGVVKFDVDLPPTSAGVHPCVSEIMAEFRIEDRRRPSDAFLVETARQAWKGRIGPSTRSALIARLREQADADAISVFSRNLRDLLLAPPAGARTVLGVDPGIRTGCKLAVCGPTGTVLETAVIYPHEPRRDWSGSLLALEKLCRRHGVNLISIGNGTACRETDRLVADLLEKSPSLSLQKVIVSEAGASVYSASEIASKEFPDLDVTLRGAVSIARRVQDPLAELVKIEPKAIGVGQYQHDVDPGALAASLAAVVEDCVNAVGVDVNRASAPLLSHVSGLNRQLAESIVAFREANGPYRNRNALKKVPRLGPKTFEQSAGFLRIADGENRLDSSSVHPEAYDLVRRIAKSCGRPVELLIGDKAFLSSLRPEDFADERFGAPTIVDIISELEKPGRDPRGSFRTAHLRDDVNDIADLRPGMRLEGTVTNVAAFGAFIDIGVHQDGLVHISELSDRFVKDAHDFVRPGQVVTVVVKDVDTARKRIALSMKTHPGGQDQRRRPEQAAPSDPFRVLREGRIH